jgi:hypothetical protein
MRRLLVPVVSGRAVVGPVVIGLVVIGIAAILAGCTG